MSLPNPGLDAVPFTNLPAEFLDDMNENIEALADGSGQNDYSIPPSKLALVNYQTDDANTIASVTNGAIKFQAGWGQLPGTGAATLTNGVTFPEAFTTILGISLSFVGAKNTTAMTDITDVAVSYAASGVGYTISTANLSETSVTVTMSRDAGTFSSSIYWGYSWMAWGIL